MTKVVKRVVYGLCHDALDRVWFHAMFLSKTWSSPSRLIERPVG